VVTINLKTHPDFVQSHDTLFATGAINSTYQWLNCTTGIIIPGAHAPTYVAASNGNYAVITTNANCTDTSACHTVSITGLGEYHLQESSISPNPFSDQLRIILPEHISGITSIRIFDAFGKLIEEKQTPAGTLSLSTKNWAPGLYFVMLTNGGETAVKKLIKASSF
jgi:hypothetical protein